MPSIAAAPVLSLASVLFFASWYEGFGLESGLLWFSLTMLGWFAASQIALKRQRDQQSHYIRRLEESAKGIRTELAEQIRASQLAQQAAEENRKTIWKVFKVSPDPMAVLQDYPDGIFLAINQAFTTTFGYTREEALGKTPMQLSILANPENFVDFSRRLKPEGYVPDAETAFRSKDGRIIWGLLSAVTIEVGGYSYVNWIVRNITDRKRMESELIAAREAAEAASRAKSEFLSSMSHEIRTPMNAVLGMAQLLAETDLSEDQRHYLDLMVTNGNALLELINSILDLAKIESGRMQIEHSEFNLIELMDKTVATFGVRAHSKGLELVARIVPDTPECLVGDPLRLRQILTNLLGNAIKFTECGEIVVEVEQSARLHDAIELKFTVLDTGIGIPPDKLESIFRNFTQADSSTTRKYGGSGLGLAIAHRLVALMGGEMSVESEPGKGSRFSFTAHFGQTVSVMVKTLPVLAGYRVLIADDNRTARQILREMLAQSGAEADEATGGKNAFSSIRQAAEEGRPYQLVLLDMGMPAVDGFEVARRLRRLHLTKSLLPMLSSDELKRQITRLQQLGVTNYLVKPVTRKGLFGSIQTMIDQGQPSSIAATEVSAKTPRVGTGKILIAEDSPDNRLVIAAYLRREPYKLDFAEDGRQAFNKFIRNSYDLVFMDIQMPEMDGLDATRAIRRWELEHGHMPTPIVALTAYALQEDVRRALSAGCNAHLSKPLKKQLLIECIRKALHFDPANDSIHQAPRSPYYS
ncbi:MAG TPA: response regulator [Candidatus Binataceae bacterium]|nr:response regulator [Candidatus Binataceae bacterium]